VSGCTNSRLTPAPVSSQSQLANQIPNDYVVRRNDSLYMIAMEFDLNYLDLARWNSIKSPYTIFRGDKLQLQANNHSGYYIVKRGDTLSGVAEKIKIKMQKLASWNNISSPYSIHIGQRLRINATQKITERKSSKRERSTNSSAHRLTNMRSPTLGKIIKRYSKQKGVTGVEFAGKQGDPIRAAADGKVVYSGTGLVRYGKLLIIEHNNNILTTYAHNSQLQVKEGDVVKIGEQIAKMGSSGTDRVKLLFEVRKNGKPVNPLSYLSKKN